MIDHSLKILLISRMKKLLCLLLLPTCQLFPLIVSTGFSLFTTVEPAFTQTEVLPIQPETQTANASQNGLYFADVVVRGRPIFQIGSLASVSASERAQIINRRLAGILAQSKPVDQIEVKPDSPRKFATLQLNNRVIMTVTEQDARDFGLEVEVLAQRWAQKLEVALETPPLAIDVGQRLYGTVRQLLGNTIEHLPSFIGAILVISITWGVAKGVRYAALTWAQQTEGDTSTEILIGRLGYGGVWVIGSVIALGILGLDFGALLGALGLTSVAIGFSLKDVLSNYISGVILLAARPFKIKDQVVIGNYEGTITQIQLRATTLKTYDGRLVYIPNQEIFQASITNNTASPRRRSLIVVGIDYSEDINQAKQIIFDLLENIEKVEKDPTPDILVSELGASTVNLEVRFWVDSRRAGFLATTSEVTQAVKEGLEKADIEMPTDIYTLVLRNYPDPIQSQTE